MALPVIAVKSGSVALIAAIKKLLAKRGAKAVVVGSSAAANEFIRKWKLRQNNRVDRDKKKDDKVVVIINNNPGKKVYKPKKNSHKPLRDSYKPYHPIY